VTRVALTKAYMPEFGWNFKYRVCSRVCPVPTTLVGTLMSAVQNQNEGMLTLLRIAARQQKHIRIVLNSHSKESREGAVSTLECFELSCSFIKRLSCPENLSKANQDHRSQHFVSHSSSLHHRLLRNLESGQPVHAPGIFERPVASPCQRPGGITCRLVT